MAKRYRSRGLHLIAEKAVYTRPTRIVVSVSPFWRNIRGIER